MGIIWTVLLVFVGVMIIWGFDIKENVWHEKKEKKSEDKKEVKKAGKARTDLDYYSLFKGNCCVGNYRSIDLWSFKIIYFTTFFIMKPETYNSFLCWIAVWYAIRHFFPPREIHTWEWVLSWIILLLFWLFWLWVNASTKSEKKDTKSKKSD